ncbi:MAG: BrnT family toxin [Beijerinckiaceae bacterium]|nr:BrnT family toxin [Bosea sp. (in: a-proteobacteria)]MBX9875690.1 BrnT family toxin [Beijerinckiaceae bacterium]MDP3409475.1 BrnT family toxin [Bosea sp. (in: a-proteobacteria)]
MKITFHDAKRDATMEARGLDFADAAVLFAGPVLTQQDDRFDYGEERFLTYGMLAGRLVMVVWTPRGEARHVISMRHCHEREAQRVLPALRRPR